MRLLFLSNLYPPFELGGYEQQCQEVADGLRRRGYQVLILTSNYGVNGSHLVEEDVRRTLHLQTDPYHYKRLDFFSKRHRQEKENKIILLDTINSYEPDLVLVWGMYLLSRNLPYWLEQWIPERVAYYISSYWPDDQDVHIQYWTHSAGNRLALIFHRAIGKVAINRLQGDGYPPSLQLSKAVCCSQFVRDFLVDRGKLTEDASVLNLRIDPQPFLQQSASGDFYGQRPLKLVYFGSVLPHKGVHTAIEALGCLNKLGLIQRVHLTIIGGGPGEYETYLQKLVQDLEITRRVTFVGRIPRSAVPSWLGRFDVFLFTSTWAEPFARTLIEAMAAGLAVIWSDVGGTREMFTQYPEDTSFPPGNSEALAHQIRNLLDYPGTVQDLGKVGQSYVLEHLTLEHMLDEMEAWFKKSTG